jgi:UDP:flavonoid glycosyltransferase YjiC (YdhE family)
MYMPQLRNTHELLACPPAFDFPRPQSAYRSYIESVDLQRKEVGFPWDDLDPNKPLVYCSFGTQSYQRDNVAQLLRCLVSVAQLRPNFQFVIATGAQAGLVAPSPNAANLVIVQRAPQLALLSRAQVMITHAGLGSIKECLACGVPMLAFPLAIDQPGNAARIKHHGLGIVGNVRRISTDKLILMLDQLIGDPSFKGQAKRMMREFERVENASTGVTLIEALLTGAACQHR